MAIYVIGDIQGCFDELQRLLTKFDFNPRSDRLWFTGDLVNRGPKSLETLRFVKNLGESANIVLGNHDLHLLACYFGKRKMHKSDTFKAILKSKDCIDLLDWLRHQPIFRFQHNYCLVHAGLAPQWDLLLAQQCAAKVEKILRNSDKANLFFEYMYGDIPDKWDNEKEGWPMIRFITNAFTRMRYCKLDGSIDTKHKGRPGTQPDGLIPWYEYPKRKNKNLNILFGHWSTLGYLNKKGVYGLDTGCLWGGHLSALKLNDENDRNELIQVCCKGSKS